MRVIDWVGSRQRTAGKLGSHTTRKLDCLQVEQNCEHEAASHTITELRLGWEHGNMVHRDANWVQWLFGLVGRCTLTQHANKQKHRGNYQAKYTDASTDTNTQHKRQARSTKPAHAMCVCVYMCHTQVVPENNKSTGSGGVRCTQGWERASNSTLCKLNRGWLANKDCDRVLALHITSSRQLVVVRTAAGLLHGRSTAKSLAAAFNCRSTPKPKPLSGRY